MIYKILDILKKEKKFISGENIAKTLSVSRTAIWKNISKLKNMGYEIISVTNKGYKLIDNQNIYNEFEIKGLLKTRIFGKVCHFFDEIGSTNDFAKEITKYDTKEGTIVVSNYQSLGRGRFDRAWICKKGDGIFLSIILKPQIELFYTLQISLIAGITICQALREMSINAELKWPNDIMLNNKKVGGILCEVSAQIDKVDYIILGIGINVNNKNFSEELNKKATSIFIETNKKIDKKIIIANFLYKFEAMYYEYINTKSFIPYLEQYKNLCINIGKDVTIKGKNIKGKVLDISHKGEIIIQTENGLTIVISGEVSLRTISGEYI